MPARRSRSGPRSPAQRAVPLAITGGPHQQPKLFLTSVLGPFRVEGLYLQRELFRRPWRPASHAVG